MDAIKVFLKEVLLPIALAFCLASFLKPIYMPDGVCDYFLMWICVGLPFGIRRMCLWLVPSGYGISGSVGIFALNLIIGGLNEAALIGGLISNYFLRPAVSAALKNSYIHVLEHLHTGRVSAADLKQIQKALTFLMPTCQLSREAQRDLMGASLKTTALLSSCR